LDDDVTEPTQDPATPDPAADEQPAPEPVVEATLHETTGLPENAPSYTLDKSVNTTQLTDELEAAGAQQVVIVLPQDFDGTVTAEDPVKVYVVGGSAKKIQAALDAHDADSQYGMTDEQKVQAAALAKVQDPNAEVTVDDLKTALNALLNPAQPAEAPASA
jgi:hypothetical protein